jgi:hypothetical protein
MWGKVCSWAKENIFGHPREAHRCSFSPGFGSVQLEFPWISAVLELWEELTPGENG